MPPATAILPQKEVERTLKKVEEGLRTLAAFRQRPEVIAGCGTRGKNAEELRRILETLQRHHAELRRWSSNSQTQSRTGTIRKLEDAKTRIEREMKRFQDPTRLVKSEATLGRAPAIKQCDLDNEEPVNLNSSQTNLDGEEPASEDVKVQADQLCSEQAADKEIIDEFICKICQVHVVGSAPKLARCSHLFCGDCIAKWFATHPGNQTWAQRAQAKGSVPCPVCKELLQEDTDLHLVCPGGHDGSAFLWQMLSSLRIVCINHKQCRPDGGCTWTGEYGNYQMHARVCNNSPVVEEEEEPVEVVHEEPPEEVQEPDPPIVPEPEVVPDSWDDDLDDQDFEDHDDANDQELDDEQPPAPASEPSSSRSVCSAAAEAFSVDALQRPVDEPSEASPAEAPSQGAPAEPSQRAPATSNNLSDLICALMELKVKQREKVGFDSQPAPEKTEFQPASASSSSEAPVHTPVIQPAPVIIQNQPRAAHNAQQAQQQHLGAPGQAPASRSRTRLSGHGDFSTPNAQNYSFHEAAQWMHQQHQQQHQHHHQQWQQWQQWQQQQARARLPQPPQTPPPPQPNKAALVLLPFKGDGPTNLSLQVGDLVEVLERHTSGWTFGRKVYTVNGSPAGAEGWFPAWATGSQ